MNATPWLALLAACGTPAAIPLGNTAHDRAAATTSLVLVEPDADACVLRRRDPAAHTVDELARFPGNCLGARMAWTADLRRVVVWFDPESLYHVDPQPILGGHHDDPDGVAVPRWFEVELAHHAVQPLPPPPAHTLELAFGANGTLYAFVEEHLRGAEHKRVVHRGHTLDFTAISDGLAAAAIAYARTPAGWALASVTATTIGWDYARGWTAAPEAATLGPRSQLELDGRGGGEELDPATLAELAKIAPAHDQDGWTRLDTTLPVYVWVVSAEFAYRTARLAWRDFAGAVTPLPELGFAPTELVAVRTRGSYVLVVGADAGTYPRLYDVATRRLVFASETARCVMLFPPQQR